MKLIEIDLYPNGYIKTINVPGGYKVVIRDRGSKLNVNKQTVFPGKKPIFNKFNTWEFKGFNMVRE